jgi:hypothetical protein
MSENSAADFFSRYARGELAAGAIDDCIDTWHDALDPLAKDGELHTYTWA